MKGTEMLRAMLQNSERGTARPQLPRKQSFAEQLTDKHNLMGTEEFCWKIQAPQ